MHSACTKHNPIEDHKGREQTEVERAKDGVTPTQLEQLHRRQQGKEHERSEPKIQHHLWKDHTLCQSLRKITFEREPVRTTHTNTRTHTHTHAHTGMHACPAHLSSRATHRLLEYPERRQLAGRAVGAPPLKGLSL